ncbi:SCY1-like protein 2 [Varroa jacobsoni]|uniref:SCY1-like protein 2 n=1 Tax=Varroa jacobsoni TaxID=62625 RepID=UPI000BF2EF00|nr:SCY1-like protein 2 [Varroa jacobsoni]
MSPIGCQGFTSKLPKMGQPDLDYTAPEVHATSSCSPQSDMFSLGLLITALFNQGHSLLESQLSISIYTQRIEEMDRNLHSLLEKIPHHLQEPLQGLLNMDAKRRPNSRNFSIIKYFMDPGVHALQYLDVIQMKDSTHKTHYYHNLKQTLPAIPKKLWWQHILPSLQAELQSPEVLAATLQPLLFMIDDSSPDEYQTTILPVFKSVFGMPKSVQATVTLLENIEVLMAKSPKADIRSDVLPMVYNSFESTAPQIQCASIRAAAHVAEFLDENAVRKMVLPRTRSVFETNSGQKVQANALTCIEQVMDKLEKNDTLDQVLPMLEKAKVNDPAILMPVVRIYKRMLDDKRYGLTVHLLATKVLPALIPVAVNPALKLDQFQELTQLCQEMLDAVSKNQRNKLKLDKLSLQPSSELLPVHTQQMQMQFHAIEQPTGYPHRPPSLRLESRRTSISMDDVVRRTCSSASSSPDSNLLRVQATLPGRRHSDNTIQPPRILVAPCSPGTGSPLGYTSSGVPVRRHSSVGMHQQDSRFSNFFASPKFQSPTTANNSTGLGADFFNSSRANMRRYSAAAVCGAGLPNQASSFLQQVGSGVSSLFSSK